MCNIILDANLMLKCIQPLFEDWEKDLFEKKILQCLDKFPDNVWPGYVGGVCHATDSRWLI